MTALIFGATGQDGHYLTQLLAEQGVDVVGISRKASTACDVRDFDAVVRLVKLYRPEYIFHFAAESTTQHNALFQNHETIASGTVNILEAVRIHAPLGRIFLSGSAMQFYNDGRPINEHSPFHASSPYAAARIYSTYLARYYRETFGVLAYVGYLFNHDSPLRSSRHVSQKIVQAAKAIQQTRLDVLEIGNLEVRKEFNFAGDIVAAIWLLVNQEEVYEVVIGCGIAYSIKDWVDCCFRKVGLDWRKYVTLHEGYRPEYSMLVSDPMKLRSMGWVPKLSIDELAELMMESCNDRGM